MSNGYKTGRQIQLMNLSRHFHRGVHPVPNKNTKDSPVIRLDSFSTVQIPMSMHIGAPCSCLVKPGDDVLAGQKIGDSDSFMSAPVHSGVSGKVAAVRRVLLSDGTVGEAVEILSDGLFRLHESVVSPAVNDRTSFLRAIRESGLTGLGGAGFPTHVKLNPPKGKEPDILLINAAECEPFITSDYRQCMEHPDDIVGGIAAVIKWLSIPSAVIGIEDNKKDAVPLLQAHIKQRGLQDQVSIKILRTFYPQGAEKILIKAAAGREVPSGGLPHDVRALVLNVSTVAFISEYLRTGMPLVRKIVTLDGGAVASPCNVDVPIGALISDVIEAAGGFREPAVKIIMGGPMMGVAIDRTDLGIIKANNAILALSVAQTRAGAESPCIRCGRCVDSCPIRLLPTSLDAAARREDIEDLRALHAADCIECGCCAYVCPAGRHLVQSIRYGKRKLRLESTKQKAEVKP